jgi:hypothetical protein
MRSSSKKLNRLTRERVARTVVIDGHLGARRLMARIRVTAAIAWRFWLIVLLAAGGVLEASSAVSGANSRSGPASATIRLTGETGVLGPLTNLTVRCGLPTLAGIEIFVLGTPSDSNLSVRIEVVAGSVTVGVDTGSGAQYQERDFAATKVTRFGAALGATLDTALIAAPVSAGTTVPNLPSITSIVGTITCGGQTAGTSTLAVSGKTATGTVRGRINPVNVSCSQGVQGQGPQVLILGIVKVGTHKALIDLNVRANLFSFFLEPASGGGTQYMGSAGSGVPSTTGAKVKGDAVEVVASGVSPHTVHVIGHAVCGRSSGA